MHTSTKKLKGTLSMIVTSTVTVTFVKDNDKSFSMTEITITQLVD